MLPWRGGGAAFEIRAPKNPTLSVRRHLGRQEVVEAVRVVEPRQRSKWIYGQQHRAGVGVDDLGFCLPILENLYVWFKKFDETLG